MLRSKLVSRLVFLLLFAAFLALPVMAQDSTPEAGAIESLQDRYKIVKLSDGWLLQPEEARDDLQAIEVRGGRVAVDGEWVDENQLRRFVDADAGLIFDLAEGRPRAVEAPPAPPEPQSTPPARPERSATREHPEDHSSERIQRVREQLEQALERAQRGETDREVLDRLREMEDLEDLPRDLDRLTRELERTIDRNERRPNRSGSGSQVTLGSNLTVERGEELSEAVVIGGDLKVLGSVDGDTTVVMGNARVEGTVDGSLVVVGGNIDVESGGAIDGDAIAVGGAVHLEPGGHIDGEIIHLDFGELMRLGDVRVGNFDWPQFDLFDFGVFDAIGRMFRILFLAVLALLVYVLAAPKVEEVASWVRGAPWRALFSGLAVEIAFVPAVLVLIVLLCVSIIGILLVCLVPPLATFVLIVVFLLGYTATVLTVGDWLGERFGLHLANRYLVILLGMAAIEVWSVLGDMVGMVPFFGWLGTLILLSAWCLKFVVWATGLGAAVLCQFSREQPPTSSTTNWSKAPRPTPPPAPPAAPKDDESYSGVYEEERDYPLLEGDDLGEGEGNPP